MENNGSFNKEKRIIKSVEQAKIALNMLLQDPDKQHLEKGLTELPGKLKNPKLDVLLDRYPDLLQEYDLTLLLSGNVEITGARIEDIRTAGLLSCLQLLIHFCYELKESPNPADPRLDSLNYILSSIACNAFVGELLIIIISVVGQHYYEIFQQKIQSFDFDLENAIEIENDPELQEHIGLMTWFALARLFLESVYTCFKNPDKNFENQTF